MKIRITKCSYPSYWYADKVGQIFEVNYNKHIKHYDVLPLKKEQPFILKEDAEIVEEEPVKSTPLKIRVHDNVPVYGGKVFEVERVYGAYRTVEIKPFYYFSFKEADVVEEVEKSCETCRFENTCLYANGCNDQWISKTIVPLISEVETADKSKIVSGRKQQNKIAGVGTDAPTVVNEKGGKQSKLMYGFDAIDAKAMFALAKVMQEGREKYGYDENWRHITPNDHYNHLMTHINAWKAGDTQDEHLAHAFCRAMMLYATAEV